ncbi:FliI/YscN family ATPase [Bdellovibrio bacteriovorus]|uniref:Flagellum-specific ATP synthase n=2 Tax=Bdellovibrio bacteriovorus TaxID=959 RepID=Q6MHY3_BDEBA|nr:FliI/YscN family ATPase [Bdellovibrio bacteriovorus]AHZ83760.1 ATP synthase [Bdellovibrio bacteriovorus]ASD62509.1 flagellum-specific ATP synthase FliI [Bdellovibrio bacteriovorus]BEV69733.1 putative ATP synthase YscN [Bdellovibrio bacteriovorus]CAE78199.1 flagellum-specific ATP synthase [Bdellovibrio bacteriovorus HD100]
MSEFELNLDKYSDVIQSVHLTKDSGKVTEVNGMLIKGYLPGASVGSIVSINPSGMEKSFLAEVVGFKDKHVLMMALNDMRGVALGSKIVLARQIATVRAGEELLGRVVDGLGRPLDDKGEVENFREVPLYSEVRNPLDRRPIREPIDLGIRAINGALTAGLGQRVAIMAGSGVGKSVLLGMMARNTNADVNVIAMIGERGREVREFIEHDLGPEGMKRSVVVCVTSDQSPLLRMRGAYVATALAEYFSSQGKNVLLMMDSVTRFAMAQREIGLSTGEPPSQKGYTPSVFATLPKLLERAGSFEGEGSITGFYTTLVEGDDMNDPIGDSVRSIVDGHIVLSRSLAQKGHFPAIDIMQSASRVMRAVSSPEHSKLAQKLRETLAVYKDAEDLINIGAYKPGSNPKIDRAVKVIDQVNDFLKQRVEDPTNFTQTVRQMQQILINA